MTLDLRIQILVKESARAAVVDAEREHEETKSTLCEALTIRDQAYGRAASLSLYCSTKAWRQAADADRRVHQAHLQVKAAYEAVLVAEAIEAAVNRPVVQMSGFVVYPAPDSDAVAEIDEARMNAAILGAQHSAALEQKWALQRAHMAKERAEKKK